MSIWVIQRLRGESASDDRAGKSVFARRASVRGALMAFNGMAALVVLAIALSLLNAQETTANVGAKAAQQRPNLPPRVIEAKRFLARRGWTPSLGAAGDNPQRRAMHRDAQPQIETQPQAQGAATWQPLGPVAVESQSFGLVTGRVSALALDPSDTTGNTLYVGTTGGGVWRSQSANTSSPANISFLPLTDAQPPLCIPNPGGSVQEASISIGALTVQPGGTGVILAGTGDPNDALDSYYGAGILRSTDSGTTWCLIPETGDHIYVFAGEGFAGFAWSTVNQQRVVAAVSQAYEGTLVNAVESGESYEGLYYSSDSGATWSLATITDGAGLDVQGPNDRFILPDGNAATSVVWNPVRKLFIAAVRYHGYYQSTDGITWTRMAAQPGSGLTAQFCPTNIGSTGSQSCPIFRGTLAVNPQTGDTFAWTVDIDNQDQGLWQDSCVASAGACTNQTVTFARQWPTMALETETSLGPATIENGDYNLALAAVPSQQDTLLMAGANDLWKCSLAMGCQWRNTTNSTAGFCAQVGEYQHALAWNPINPLEIFLGNDSGLWRSTDAIGETGPVCSASDATHFQNLNGSLGSLAEVVSISQVGSTPYAMMAGLGANGIAGVKSTTGATADWPEILGGEGGPVEIDPVSNNWYANNQAGVSIYRCSQSTPCTPADFGSSPVVTDADVGGDGLTMTSPAPFLVDPLASSELLIGTCRVWRGPADGVGWGSGNAISPMLDGSGNPYCSGNALIRSMAAQKLPVSAALPSGGEVIYVGMYGSANGGATLPGHVFSVTLNAAGGAMPAWSDLTLNPVTNDSNTLNYYGLDISSIFIDPHDPTGKTVYVTVAGFPTPAEVVQTAYRSTDGGRNWAVLTSNLPTVPANSLVVDPQDADTVYVATDAGVYSTRAVASCTAQSSQCWSAFGSGLPEAPVVELSAAPQNAAVQDLVAATYGRGIWVTTLLTATVNNTTATATPASLTFASQAQGSSSSAQTVTVKNTGNYALTPSFNTTSGDFNMNGSVTGGCQSALVAAGSSCTIQVTFSPSALGVRTGVLTISGNLTGANLTVSFSGAGAPSGVISLAPATLPFSTPVEVGNSSASLPVTINNSGSPAIPFTYAVTGPFSVSSGCAGGAVPANGSCPLNVTFTPTQAGAASGTLTLTDAASNSPQTVALSGTGLAAATDALSPASLTFATTVVGQLSAAQSVTLTNSGGVTLTSIAVSVTGAFQLTNHCTANLAANSNCAISVVYAASQTGGQTGTLTVSDVLRTQTVALNGTGVQPPAFAVSPASLNFAAQTVGVASAPQTVTVSNNGGAPMAGVGFAITPSSGSGFSCSPNACSATTCPTLASGASCTMQVIFTPAAAGGSTASLAVSSSTAGVKPINVPLTGAGQVLTGINVNPAQLLFPIIVPGQSSPSQTVTVTNTGGSAANSLTLTATPPFSLVQNGCDTTLAAGASCSTGVIFSPTLNGPYTGTLTIASTSLASSASVALSGTGGVPGSVLAQPSLVEFSETGVGLLSDSVAVTFTNPSGAAALTNFALAATPGFRLVNNACPSTLAAGVSCTVGVEFVPTNAGAQTGSLTVSSSALSTGDFVPLSGMGFDFAVAPSGSSSQAIANGQTADYKLVITPLLGSQGVFNLSCGTLPPYTSCTFNPGIEGIPANTTGSEIVEIATGLSQTVGRASRPSAWPVLPLLCGLLLAPFAAFAPARRRRALLLIAVLVLLAGGVSSCTQSSGGAILPPPHSGAGITPAGTYSIPVTVSSNGVVHQVALTLTVD